MRNEGGLAIIYCQYNAFLLPYYVAEAETVERVRIRINGIVQGVGFRPFIHRLVSEHGLNGMIRNNSSGVEIELDGERAVIERFVEDIPLKAPRHALIREMKTE